MPGWTPDLPFKHLVAAFARRASGDSTARFDAAEAALRRLDAAGVPALRASPMFRHVLAKHRERLSASYFAHEYLTPAWQPLYVTELRTELATIGLKPVGSATFADNFDGFVLQAPQRDALAEIADEDLRELARDCMLMTRFRRDVFCRDPVTLSEREQRRAILRRRFALVRPEPLVDYAMRTPAGRLRFDNPVARHIVAALAEGPLPLRQLGREPKDLVTNALALASAEIIRPVNGRDAPVGALNRALAELDSEAISLPYRAVPCGTAVVLAPALHRYLRGGGRLPKRLRAWPDFLARATRESSCDAPRPLRR
jgi:hypothetical protein